MPSFEQLIAPISVETFFREYLERQPLHLGGRPSLYSELFSWEQMEDFAYRSARSLSAQDLRVFRMAAPPGGGAMRLDEIAVPAAGTFDLSEWMRARYRDGYTFYFKRVDGSSARLAQLMQDMRLLFNCEATASAYVTPPHAQGFHAHYDTEDVVILQIHGEKRWVLHGEWDNLPARKRVTKRPAGTSSREVLLKPGDLLYLPRGCAHEPSTGDTPSLHLTLWIFPYRWMDLVKELCERAADTELTLRRRVPCGPGGQAPDSSELTQGLSEALRCLRRAGLLQEVLQFHRRRLLESCTVAGGIFTDPTRAAVSGSTLVRRVGECLVSSDGERAGITAGGCTIATPLSAHEALESIASAAGPFEVAALPDSLDEESKRVLVSRLLRECVLERVEPASS